MRTYLLVDRLSTKDLMENQIGIRASNRIVPAQLDFENIGSTTHVLFRVSGVVHCIEAAGHIRLWLLSHSNSIQPIVFGYINRSIRLLRPIKQD